MARILDKRLVDSRKVLVDSLLGLDILERGLAVKADDRTRVGNAQSTGAHQSTERTEAIVIDIF